MSMKNIYAAALTAAVVFTSGVMSASAQEDEAQGRRPGGRFGRGAGGPGGPGGMLGMAGRGMGAVALLSREDVREELKLLPDQLEGLKKMAELQRPERPDFDFRNASDEERAAFAAKMQAQQAERAADTRAQLEELLLPEQLERLDQIALQAQGAAALVTPEVAEKLGLSAETNEAMKKVMEGSIAQGQEMMATAMRDRDFDSVREKVQAMRKELEEKLVSQLSSDQKAKFEELKGDPFELTDAGWGGFGGRGPGGRGPGGLGGPGGRGGRGPGGAGAEGGAGGRRGGGEDRPRRPRD